MARSVLKKQMGRHGKDLESLLAAVVALDHDLTAAVADRIAGEPRIARPGSELGTANALFPERFFQLQDALHDEASRLAASARARDDEALGGSFGRVAATCVACHSVYVRLPGGR
jgi:cytochrome c556